MKSAAVGPLACLGRGLIWVGAEGGTLTLLPVLGLNSLWAEWLVPNVRTIVIGRRRPHVILPRACCAVTSWQGLGLFDLALSSQGICPN